MTKSFLKDLEDKRLIPVGKSPYVELVEANPVLDEGLNLHDFYSITSLTRFFARGITKVITLKKNGEPIDTPEKFGRLYVGLRRKLAELVNDKKFRGGLKPLELFLVFEYIDLQKRGQFSSGVVISDRSGGHYPHVNFLWECALADYANQVDIKSKELVLGNESKFNLNGVDLAKIVLTNERNPLPMRNSLQFLHTVSNIGTISEDDATFNRLGIPQAYLNYLRNNFEMVPMEYALWNGNASLFAGVCLLANHLHSYSERFNDFLGQFDRYKSHYC